MFALIGVIAGGVIVVLGPAPPRPIPRESLAQTPPMGFDNRTVTFCDERFNDEMVRGIADAMVSTGLENAGYEYVNLDDCWASPERNSDAELVPDPTRFPNGIKALADYVHDKGLKFGIYTNTGNRTCDPRGFPDASDYEVKDATLFATWGVDLVKYDNCNDESGAEERYRAMRDALDATGRPIVLSIDEWGQDRPASWADRTGQTWGTGGHIEDTWNSVLDNLGKNLAAAQGSSPGHWNDPDLLLSGNGGMTLEQYRSQFSLWSVMAAPLIIGSDLRQATPETLATISNPDVIAVDQDPSGIGGREVSSRDGLHVIAKPLAGGDLAVALFNENAAEATIDANLNDAGFDSGMYVVKDLWSKDSRTASGNMIGASVAGYSTVLLRISPVGPRPAGRWDLSDVLAFSSSNGWGPVQVDRSNGEEAPDDGRPLTMNGMVHTHGLGMHAPSEAAYYLGGSCKKFSATVGIDDEVHGDGSVVFQIYVDDALAADSGLVRTTTAPKNLEVDLTRADKLKLVVTDSGDGIEFDHADWADPVVDCG